MKKCSFILWLFFSVVVYSQSQKKIDSLKMDLLHAKSDSLKIHFYDQLVKAYIYKNPVISKKYNDSIFLISKDLDQKMLATYNLGVIQRIQADYPNAVKNQEKYLDYALKRNDTLSLLKVFYQLGNIHLFLDNKEKATTYFLQALKISDSKSNKLFKSKILNSLGVIYKNSGDYLQAKKHYKQAIDICNELKNDNLKAIVCNSIGIVLSKQDSLDKALNYFKKSLAIAEKVNNKSIMSYQYRNIGTIFKSKNKLKQAEEHYLKALNIRKQLKQDLGIGGSYYDLADLYTASKQYNKAEKYYTKALHIFSRLKSVGSKNAVIGGLSDLYALKGNYKKSNEFLNRYYATKDSLENVELQEKINLLNVQYESEKKDNQINEQNLVINKQTNKLLKQEIKKNQYLILLIIVFFGFLLFYLYFKQKQKINKKEIESLKIKGKLTKLKSIIEGQENERKRLAQDLHDGINGDLSVIKYKISSVNPKKLNLKEKEEYQNAIFMLDNAIEQIRHISHNLVPPSLLRLSLKDALEQYCIKLAAVNKINIVFQYYGNPVNLDKEKETAIYRIVQELLNNIIKHAKATDVLVQINNHDNRIHITVEDNGIGYDVRAKQNGLGLKNVKSRIDFLQANMTVESDSNGTIITIELILDE